MSRFILLTVVLMIIGGFFLHYGISFEPFTNWLGKLPGDFSLQKGDVVVYFPLATAMIVSFLLTLISYLLFS